MNFKALKSTGRAMAALGLAGALTVTCAGVGRAESNRAAAKHELEGTWIVQVTLRNCANNAPLGTFASLVTFHRGGSVSETTSSPTFAVGQRSPGHGNWGFQGHHTYSQRFVNLINFDTAPNLPGTPGFNPSLPVTPGFFAGWSTVTHALQLTDPDHATSLGTNEFFRADGTSYRTGCSTAVAQRFE